MSRLVSHLQHIAQHPAFHHGQHGCHLLYLGYFACEHFGTVRALLAATLISFALVTWVCGTDKEA